ncbi:hypothetical protein G6F50_017101 [Rhizopus delemar]|uniref:Uncharacterized protein n=1 Tax=Rhizopus delemar TaxID=936053 RepID=A0A9P7C119_9FUNG|nr:hypothetical protein G6F50_017101 [Rhizopus delemar]
MSYLKMSSVIVAIADGDSPARRAAAYSELVISPLVTTAQLDPVVAITVEADAAQVARERHVEGDLGTGAQLGCWPECRPGRTGRSGSGRAAPAAPASCRPAPAAGGPCSAAATAVPGWCGCRRTARRWGA